jgi:hypothetical protein
MGVLIPNGFRRQVSITVLGKTAKSLETLSVLQAGTVLRIKAGAEEGSKTDGSAYSTLFAQVRPGTVARITAYGDADVAAVNALKPGDQVSALMTPIRERGMGYKLVEFIPTEAPATPPPAPPAA